MKAWLKTIGIGVLGAAASGALDAGAQYVQGGGPIRGKEIGTVAAIGALMAVKGFLLPSPLNPRAEMPKPQEPPRS